MFEFLISCVSSVYLYTPDQHINNNTTRDKSIVEYILHTHDIIPKYSYTNVYIYCRLYMQPQIHTACTRCDKVEQILLYY